MSNVDVDVEEVGDVRDVEDGEGRQDVKDVDVQCPEVQGGQLWRQTGRGTTTDADVNCCFDSHN